jgi:hypothetical protein
MFITIIFAPNVLLGFLHDSMLSFSQLLAKASYSAQKTRTLGRTPQLHNAIRITLVAYVLTQAPQCMLFPVDQTFLKQLDVLARPYHPLTPWRAVSESEHTDIEGMNELEASSHQYCRVLHHLLRLAPFMECLNGYKLRRDGGLKEQSSLKQPAE